MVCVHVCVCVYPREYVTLEREVKGRQYKGVGLRHSTLNLSCIFQAVLRVVVILFVRMHWQLPNTA